MTKFLEHYVSLDSRERNRAIWPKSSQFETRLEPSDTFVGATIHRAFKNVVSVEVVDVMFPNANNVLNEMYLYLTIPEIDGNIETSAAGGTQKPIAKLIPSHTVGNYVVCRFEESTRPKKVFYSQGARLDKLTVELRKYDNTIFDFGADTTEPTAPSPTLQVNVTLRIVVEQPYVV